MYVPLNPRFTGGDFFVAQVAELVDACVSGTYASNGVEVRVLSWALI